MSGSKISQKRTSIPHINRKREWKFEGVASDSDVNVIIWRSTTEIIYDSSFRMDSPTNVQFGLAKDPEKQMASCGFCS